MLDEPKHTRSHSQHASKTTTKDSNQALLRGAMRGSLLV